MAADPRTVRESAAPPRDRWTIDVCATCGALARWPFTCGHRPEHYTGAGNDVGWTVPVQVRPAYPGEYRATMAREARRRS